MENTHKLGIWLLLVIGVSYTARGQDDCKVYSREIADRYTGECKKGLAHGDGRAEGDDIYEGRFNKGYPQGIGTYTYRNGNTYVGEFKRGLKDGKGEFTFRMNGKDTTTVGYWLSDEYIGEKYKSPYKVLSKISVDRLSFKHTDSDDNEIVIEFFRAGVVNRSISNLSIQNSSGTFAMEGNWLRVKNIELPFVGQVRYTTTNTLGSTSIACSFRFEINQKGKWQIRVAN